ncbi:unnamed protein product [Brassica oleracea var. botrytis]|uniref:Uncharacterized protein n=1 Tax=Brassica oleracea TaxID=3712 RepID=A0A3P6AU26_BRAOL|nr:unnamed protein product [Brassica oleracea]
MVITLTFLSYSICLRYIIQTSWLFLEMRHMKLVFFIIDLKSILINNIKKESGRIMLHSTVIAHGQFVDYL